MPADIAVADVTVTLSEGDSYNPPGQLNESFPTISFGDGALLYPTYGVPLPVPGKFGMDKEVKRILITQPLDGYEYRYDKTVRAANPVGPNGTIRIFKCAGSAAPLVELGHVAVAAVSLDLTVKGQ